MLISLLTFLLISNALSLSKDKSILFSRIVMVSLILTSFLAFNNLFVISLDKGIGIYGGLFHVTAFTQSFNIFIFLISAIILTLTSFYPRKVYLKEYSSLSDLLSAVFYLNVIKNIFFFKDEYKINPSLENLNLEASIEKYDGNKESKVNFKLENIVLSSALSNVISILTLILLLFIYIPNEWFSIANILTLILFKP